jgi:Flp pilus assembly protein TadG
MHPLNITGQGFIRREGTSAGGGRKARQRRGASLVEFAIVAPIVFFVCLALVQFAGLLMSQNVLTAAAREGGRVASLPSTTSNATVIAAVEQRLSRGGIDPDLVNVVVSPTTFTGLKMGDDVSVTVSAQVSDMGWIWAVAPPDAHLSAEITYDRE